MRGNTNENWEIVSVFYSWEGHPILQIGPVWEHSVQLWSDSDFSWSGDLCVAWSWWLCVAGYGHYLLFPNLIDYDIGGWLSRPSVYLLSYAALSANQRPVLTDDDQWGGVFAVLWLLLCPMVIMWPDTTISDDRRATDNRAGDWTQQVSRVDTGPRYVNRVRSQESGRRMEPSVSSPGLPVRPPPAGKWSLDNTQSSDPDPAHLPSPLLSPLARMTHVQSEEIYQQCPDI